MLFVVGFLLAIYLLFSALYQFVIDFLELQDGRMKLSSMAELSYYTIKRCFGHKTNL